jgi:hypothetical protein
LNPHRALMAPSRRRPVFASNATIDATPNHVGAPRGDALASVGHLRPRLSGQARQDEPRPNDQPSMSDTHSSCSSRAATNAPR